MCRWKNIAVAGAVSLLLAGCASQAEIDAFHAGNDALADRYDDLLIGQSLAELQSKHAERWARYIARSAEPRPSFYTSSSTGQIVFTPWLVARYELVYPYRETRYERESRLANMDCQLKLSVDDNGVIVDTYANPNDIAVVSGMLIGVDLRYKPSICAHTLDHELGLPKQPGAESLFLGRPQFSG